MEIKNSNFPLRTSVSSVVRFHFSIQRPLEIDLLTLTRETVLVNETANCRGF